MNTRQRSVSPSLISETRRLRGPSSRRGAPARKRKLPFRQAADDAMDCLDDLAESGEVTSNAYNVLAKKLKDVHDSVDSGKTPVIENVVMEYAMQEPSTLVFAPSSVQTWSPVFVRTLVLKFLSAAEEEHWDLPSPSVWKDKLVTHYMGLDNCVVDEARIRDAIEIFTIASPDQFVTAIIANLHRLYHNMAVSAWEIFDEDGDEMVRLAETSPPFREALMSLLDATDSSQNAVREKLISMRKEGDIHPCQLDPLRSPTRSMQESEEEENGDEVDYESDTNATGLGREGGRAQDREHNDSESDGEAFRPSLECECPRCLSMQEARSAIQLRDELEREAA